MLNNEIRQDFKSNWFVCLILIIGMVPLWAKGYCMYLLILLLPVVLLYYRKIDGTSLLILIFSILYTYFQKSNGHAYTPSSLIFDLLFPFIIYQTGAYLVERQKSPKSAMLLLCLMSLALAIPAIVENVNDAIKTGQLINVSRTIEANSGDAARAATGYGMMLAILDGCLGIVLLKPGNKLDARLKGLIAIVSILAIFSTIHLLNRTGLVLAAVSIVCVVLLPPYSYKKSVYTFVSMIIVAGAAIYIFEGSAFFSDALNQYEARDTGVGSVGTYGGRSQIWGAAIDQLFTEPWGNAKGVNVNGRYRFAHNMWLDTGAYAGIIPMCLLLGIGIIYISAVIKMYRFNYLNQFERNTLVLIGVALFLQLNTEPVMQGLFQFFLYFMFYISILNNLNRKYGVEEYTSQR